MKEERRGCEGKRGMGGKNRRQDGRGVQKSVK